MAKNRAIPQVADPTTDRALKALAESVRELIDDQQRIPRTPYEEAQVVPPKVLKSAPNVVVDASKTNNFILILDQNVIIANPTGVKAGQIINISIHQTTGGHTATWGSAWKHGNGRDTLTATAGAFDLYSGRVETVSNGAATLVGGSLVENIS